MIIFQVVANAVTALTDIHDMATSSAAEGTAPDSRAEFIINTAVLTKLLIALNECSEWGRVAILSALARYRAQDEKESEHICERVIPQFQHANGSVVLAAVKVRSGTSYVARRVVLIRLLGDHDTYAECSAGRSVEAASAEDGSSIRCVPTLYIIRSRA